jgi:hypothetical protein
LRFCGAFGSAVGLMLSLPFTVEAEAMNAANNPSLPKSLRRPLMGAEAGRVCGVGANQSFSARSLLHKSIRGLSAGKLETRARIKLTAYTTLAHPVESVLIAQIKLRRFILKNTLKYVKMIVLITLKV